MQITTSTHVSASSGNPRKASIMRQIKRLEKKRNELLEKLGMGKESREASTDSFQGTPTVNNTATASRSVELHLPGAQTKPADGSRDAIAAVPAAAPASGGGNSGSLFHNLQNAASSGEDSLEALEEDPREILKQIQLIEMQISMLRQQLGDDARTLLEAVTDEKDEDPADLAATALAASIEEKLAPAVEVVDGRVDGYA